MRRAFATASRAAFGLASFAMVSSVGCGDVDDGEACDAGTLGEAAIADAPADAAKGRCIAVDDCEEARGPCYTNVTCEEGRCRFSVKGFAEPVGTDPTPGDCQRPVCDGFGAVVSGIADGDVPDDGNDCTVDFCIEGIPHEVHPSREDGTPCGPAKAGVCAGGVCVGP